MSFRNQTGDAIQTRCVVPTAVARYIKKEGDNPGAFRQIKLTLTNVPISVTDASAFGSVKLLTLPEGWAFVQGCVANDLAFTTTSALATTLNTGSTVQFGLGTAAASATTLDTTMINLAPGTGQTVPTFTSSTTVNVAGTAVDTATLAVPAQYNGSGTAMPVYLNLAVGTGTDIDGNATLTVSGTIYLTVALLGDN